MLERLYALDWWLSGRCFICERRAIVHTPRQWRVCNKTPLPIIVTERGMAYAAVAEAEEATAEAAH
jgi:hypothetical protein